ncbi:MAG: HlyD family efflux transporter periplasmic adaptor subunit [Hyphomicrobiaceae bacterium]|nr:HlyD family efflux transporter periplasmic adaptor subunit [Hyphomicrobiaceae bacterium]
MLLKRLALAAAALAVAASFAWALWPGPVSVEVAQIARGPLRVTVDEEGKTRVRDVYTVSAPATGRVLRVVLEPGDPVARNDTTVAIIEPTVPPFLDVRDRLQVEAQIKAGQAAVDLAAAEVRQAAAELQFAGRELERAKSLEGKGVVAERVTERAQLDVDTRKAALSRSQANLELRQRELEHARARRIGPEDPAAWAQPESCCVEVRAPVSGRVLKVLQRSEQVVIAGAPLIEIGDPNDLEVVVELLSTDAVQVKPGAAATIEGWGGPPLAATVARIEPSGFTKVSALGIEEQRVRTILAFKAGRDERRGLGHDYRVVARITTYEAADVLRVPQGALFRVGAAWAVFAVRDGRAAVQQVAIGERNQSFAEVLEGLEAGDRVILHPSDRIAEGVRVEERELHARSW